MGADSLEVDRLDRAAMVAMAVMVAMENHVLRPHRQPRHRRPLQHPQLQQRRQQQLQRQQQLHRQQQQLPRPRPPRLQQQLSMVKIAGCPDETFNFRKLKILIGSMAVY